MCWLGSRIVVCDRSKDRLVSIDIQSGSGEVLAPSPPTAPMKRPSAVSLGVTGMLWIADTDARRVLSFDPGSASWLAFPAAPPDDRTADWSFGQPCGIQALVDGSVVVVDRSASRLVKIAADGMAWSSVPLARPATNVTWWGNVLAVCSIGSDTIELFDTDLSKVGSITHPLLLGVGCIVSDSSALWALNCAMRAIIRIDSPTASGVEMLLALEPLGLHRPTALEQLP